MLGVTHAGIAYTSVKQNVAVARAVGISKPEKVEDQLAKVLGISGVRYWKERCVALMVALASAKGTTE
jgi:hypothetical protein